MHTALALLTVLGLAGHNRSEGSSRFVVGGDGHVDISVTLLSVDLPELCDVDLSVSDVEVRNRAEAKLITCAERGLPRWLRLSTAAGGCTVASTGVHRGQQMLEIVFDGVATCPPLAGEVLTLDWGFFAGQGLDHVSAATIVLGPDVELRTLLSKRNSRLRIHVPAPTPIFAMVAGGVGLGAVAGVGVGVLWWRRRRRQQPASQQAG